MKSKKILSVLLAAMMTASAMSFSAAAIDSTDETLTGSTSADTYYSTDIDAAASAETDTADTAYYESIPYIPSFSVTTGNRSAVLKWEESYGAVRYRAFYRLTGTSAWTSTADLTTTSYTFDGLTNGKKYDFLVLAGNYRTFSYWNESNIVVAIPGDRPVPLTPKLTVSTHSEGAWLTWTTSPNATKYRTFYRPSGTAAWTSSADITTTNNTITGLKNGVTYDFLVLAGNSVEFSAWTNADIVTKAVMGDIPDTPYDLSVIPGDRSARLKWSANIYATRYRAFWRPTGTAAWTSSADFTDTNYTVTGLTNGVCYDFLVLAGNDYTFSAWNEYDIHTETPMPADIPETPGLALYPRADGRSVTLMWNYVANATRYRAFWRVTGTGGWNSTADIIDNDSTIIKNLVTGQKYDFLVLAGNDTTFSSWTNDNVMSEVTVEPSYPEIYGLTVTPGDSSAYLSWVTSSSVTRCRVFYRPTGTSAWSSSNDVTNNVYIINGLKNGVNYDFLVLAGNNTRFSSWSDNDIIVAAPKVSSVVPKTPKVTVTTYNSSAFLTWDNVSYLSENELKNVAKYRTFYCVSGTNRWVSSGDLNTNTNRITGLTNGISYDFLVLSGNSSNVFSAWSREDVVTAVPTASPAVPKTPKLNIVPCDGRNYEILKWDNTPYATRYRVFFREKGTSKWISSADIYNNEFIVNNLDNSTYYEYLVLAGNDTTFSSWNSSDVVTKKSTQYEY